MLLTDHLLLAANLEDTIKVIITIVVMVMWGVGHLVGAAKQKPKPPAPRPRPLPPVEPGGAMQGGQPGLGPAGKPATLEETLRREVEEFMRRAQGRPVEPAKRPQIKPQAKSQQQGPPRREGARPARPTNAPPTTVRRLTDSPGGLTTPQTAPAPTGAAVGQHVMDHLTRSTQELAAHAQHLGADVAQADERMEEHLQQKFAHQLGALEHRAAEPVKKAARSPMAQEVLNMLASPGGVRQLVVASEILRRPEERWRSRQPGDK